VTTLMKEVSNFPRFGTRKRVLLIMMKTLDFEDEEEVIATDYSVRIKLDLYGNYSKYPLNLHISRRTYANTSKAISRDFPNPNGSQARAEEELRSRT
jgi:hypothetical protein